MALFSSGKARYAVMPLWNIPLAFFAVFMIICSGCSDSNLPDLDISFVEDMENPPVNSVALFRADSESEILKLAVTVNGLDIDSAYSVYFDLVFTDSIMDYLGYEPGDFFESSGEVTYQVTRDVHDPGRLIVGVSLLGAAPTVSGSGVVVFLTFKPRRAGVSWFEFEHQGMRNGDFPNGRLITGVAWYGGKATSSK